MPFVAQSPQLFWFKAQAAECEVDAGQLIAQIRSSPGSRQLVNFLVQLLGNGQFSEHYR